MKHQLFLGFAVLLLLASATQSNTALAQSPNPASGVLLIVWKYDGAASLMVSHDADRYDAVAQGKIWRAFPAGSKSTIIGDGRLPEGIYSLKPMQAGDRTLLGFMFETLPGVYERYYVDGKTLDRNIIPLDPDFLDQFNTHVARSGNVEEAAQVTLVILPGAIPQEMRDRMRLAKYLQPWLTEAALDDSARRLKPLEDYIMDTHRVPKLYHFASDGTWIIDEPPRTVDADYAGNR